MWRLFSSSVLLLSVCFTSASAQTVAIATRNSKYLALGDSLATGFNPFVNPPDLSRYVGYPLILSSALRLNLANASCPGETSSSFVNSIDPLPGFTCGANPTAMVYGPSGPVSVPMPLFVPYNGANSQLEYVSNYLKNNPTTKLITITIGGNDLAPLLVCTSDCEALTRTLLEKLAGNLTVIFSAIRTAGYKGKIIATNYYAFNYNDPRQVGPTGAFTALNSVIENVATVPLFGARVADVFEAFRLASGSRKDPCKAGLLQRIPNSTGCETHPSLLGQALIAGAVAFEFR